MYFPYLRGRQNELLCLREMLTEDTLSKTILPIIEPVRFNSTLLTTIDKFIEAKREIVIIQNPKVGNYYGDYSDFNEKMNNAEDTKRNKLKETLTKYNNQLNSQYYLKGYLCDEVLLRTFRSRDNSVSKNVLINTKIDTLDLYEENGDLLKARYTLIPKDVEFLDAIQGDAVRIDDCFTKAKRNIDYIDSQDEVFGRNHLTYKKYGYFGFSDYSIVGDSYEESGFAPLAVAIHIVYFDENKVLRIHHFVSHSNENISDPARKFAEAMESLLEWDAKRNITRTDGLNRLIGYYNSGKFPGLGVIKKCSIMHHLELIGNYLEAQNDMLY